MAPLVLKKRKLDGRASVKPAKKKRIQQYYSSTSSSSASDDNKDEFSAVDLADSSENEEQDAKSDASELSRSHKLTSEQTSATITSPSASFESGFDSDGDSPATPSDTDISQKSRSKLKRNDPAAFASSISAILGSKLTTTKRADPVLSRSATAAEANASIANSKLEVKARQKLREEKREALERGRVKDVLLGTDRPGAGPEKGDGARGGISGEQSVGEMMEFERRLRKTAQRGVVKLFNAIRQAQVKAEEARAQGGARGRKEERVEEMTKKGFLEMIAAGGGGGGSKKMEGADIEEA
ncbi:MAG: hypothetical protein Q9163_001155 [Psora crenata]